MTYSYDGKRNISLYSNTLIKKQIKLTLEQYDVPAILHLEKIQPLSCNMALHVYFFGNRPLLVPRCVWSTVIKI